MNTQQSHPDFTRRPTFGPGVRFPPNRRPMPFERDDAVLPTFNGRPEFGDGRISFRRDTTRDEREFGNGPTFGDGVRFGRD